MYISHFLYSISHNISGAPERKFGYDAAYETVRTPTACNRMPNVKLFWGKNVWPPASCEAEIMKESIKTKPESGKCFCGRVV